ncbi:MAG: diguanylate cyclase [Betaproteobacteria bacterium]|nr:diguanylate cyclase [Betaproteobacteria bacterium]
MEETLARDLSRIARIDNPLVIAMLDIDRFKTINDRFGHDAGDVVLKEVARLMMGFRAGIDVPCRFGGEEFILILPEIATKAGAESARATPDIHWRAQPQFEWQSDSSRHRFDRRRGFP